MLYGNKVDFRAHKDREKSSEREKKAENIHAANSVLFCNSQRFVDDIKVNIEENGLARTFSCTPDNESIHKNLAHVFLRCGKSRKKIKAFSFLAF